MFTAYRLSSPDEIEFYPYNAPNIRGIGRVIPCHSDPRYVLYWKKLSRDEGFALMDKYPPFKIEMENEEDEFGYWDYLDTPGGSLVYKGSLASGYHRLTIVRTLDPILNVVRPIRLWREKGKKKWVKERVDIMLDKWQGAEPAKTSVEWVKQCTARTKTAGVMMAFDFQLWLHSTESLVKSEWMAKLFRAAKKATRSTSIPCHPKSRELYLAIYLLTR